MSVSQKSALPVKLPAKHFQLVFSLVMGAMMVFVMTFFVTFINIGFTPDFLARWARAYFFAYLVAVPAIYVLAPMARRVTSRFVEAP